MDAAHIDGESELVLKDTVEKTLEMMEVRAQVPVPVELEEAVPMPLTSEEVVEETAKVVTAVPLNWWRGRGRLRPL